MNRTRFLKLVVLLCAAVFVLQGCGGDDNGIDQSVHDMLQADLAAALADKETAEGARDAATAAQAMAETERDEAMYERDAAVMTRDEANIALGAAQEVRDAATMARTTAEGERDTAMMEQTRIQGLLDAASMRVTELMGQIGSADDAESLQGMLNAAQMDVIRLEGELSTANMALTAANTELETTKMDLQTANDSLTMAQMEVTRLEGELSTANTALEAANDRIDQLVAAVDTATAETNRKKRVLTGDAAQAAIDTNRVNVTTTAIEARLRTTEAEENNLRNDVEDGNPIQLPFDAARMMPTEVVNDHDVRAARGADNMVRVQVRPKEITEEDFVGDPVMGGDDPWTMAVLTRNQKNADDQKTGGDESVAVYTDIEMPSKESIARSVPIPADGAGRRTVVLDISNRSTLAVVDVTLTSETGDLETATGTYGSIQGTFTCTNGPCVSKSAKMRTNSLVQ